MSDLEDWMDSFSVPDFTPRTRERPSRTIDQQEKRKRAAANEKQRRATAKHFGECVRCGQPASGGTSLCESHRQEGIDRARAAYARRKAERQAAMEEQ